MTNTAQRCAERIEGQLRSRINDLSRLWDAYGEGIEQLDDLGCIHHYGLCFDYVAPETFDDQKEGYFRYQLSYGGPSDEFRFYVNPDLSCHRIEYWFLDWFDGDRRTLGGGDEALLSEIWDWFCEAGTAQSAFDETANP